MWRACCEEWMEWVKVHEEKFIIERLIIKPRMTYVVLRKGQMKKSH